MTIEHLNPRSKGGSNQIDNLYLAHAHCNSRQGNDGIHQKVKFLKRARKKWEAHA